ncbi:pyroglutamyl peptidase [Nocardia transvalensis]|nr:pyroglutamyl peptidase [Nocardia transvalensis]
MRRRLATVVIPLIAMGVLGGPAAAVSAGGDGTMEPVPTADCIDESIPLGPEEARLHRPEPGELIEGGGFTDLVRSFVSDLCATTDYASALELATTDAGRLWRHAVDRAQGRVPSGSLSASDDRPLYWARLAEVAAVQQWQSSFGLSPRQRADLVAAIDRTGRGRDAIAFSTPRSTTRHVLVTGFDPFKLDADIRNGNPSGAAALALDGRVVETDQGRVEFATALFPVRWRDFGNGIVEQTLRPWLTDGPDQVDLFATVSVGSPGEFDLEQTNGAWRGGKVDNESACYLGQIPNTAAAAGAEPQWTRSTLPLPDMAAVPGPFVVKVNTTVDIAPPFFPPLPVITTCDFPALPSIPMPDGPPPGSIARAGGGGTYLSNEIAYRATLLRDVEAAPIPGGHIHVPVLQGLPEFGLTGPEFDNNRDAIITQLTTLLTTAADFNRT